ncbi:MAG: enoyl-CoA hydratase-related protein [Desulfosudaceae bacterium]
MEYINFQRDERQVAYLTLNRPGVHNAFNDGLIAELTAQVSELNADPALRVMVLTGAGESFCAGADLNWMKSMKDYSLAENVNDSRQLDLLFQTLSNSPVPVIGLVNGSALGGGAGLVAVCDYVLAAETARFGFTEVRLGLVPAVISPYVINRTGAAPARAWFLSGRRFDAATAEKIGLVDEKVSPDQLAKRGEEVVSGFLKAAPEAQRHAKALIREVTIRQGQGPEAVSDYTTDLIARLRVGDEGQEGMAALLEKRPPVWIK